jgi:hypothetical protein
MPPAVGGPVTCLRENLVLLCANCHTLLDDRAVAEVDQGLMFYLRDRAMATGHFGEVT